MLTLKIHHNKRIIQNQTEKDTLQLKQDLELQLMLKEEHSFQIIPN